MCHVLNGPTTAHCGRKFDRQPTIDQIRYEG